MSAGEIIPDPVQGLWIGERVSTLEQLSMKSFLAHGYEFHLYAYNEIAGVPEGVVMKDANAIIPEGLMEAYPAKEPPLLADWFRWALIATKGGWWADLDVVCLKPLDFEKPSVFMHTETCFFRFPAGHIVPQSMAYYVRNPDISPPWFRRKYRLRKFFRRIKIGLPFLRYRGPELGGPAAYKEALKYFDIFKDAFPNETFTCLPTPEEKKKMSWLFEPLPEGMGRFKERYCAHFYHEVARRQGIDKEGVFDPTSPYEVLKKRYGV